MTSDVRALARGLAVIEALTDTGCLSLSEFHQQVGLPKPTILRMMRTLESCGWVYRRHGDGRYQLGANLRLRIRPPAHHERLIELAGPHLDQLQARTGWPSGIGVRDGTRMLILETASYSTGFIVNYRTVGAGPRLLRVLRARGAA
jgi:IclR family mhp operon transcriptional activator